MSAAPKRIQRRRTKGWRLPPNTVCVSRPTAFGNPFTVACFRKAYPNSPHSDAKLKQICVDLHREWLDGEVPGFAVEWRAEVLRRLPELRGHDLACWCELSGPCHADHLLKLANRGAA